LPKCTQSETLAHLSSAQIFRPLSGYGSYTAGKIHRLVAHIFRFCEKSARQAYKIIALDTFGCLTKLRFLILLSVVLCSTLSSYFSSWTDSWVANGTGYHAIHLKASFSSANVERSVVGLRRNGFQFLPDKHWWLLGLRRPSNFLSFDLASVIFFQLSFHLSS
jgi:hypothetical protein